MAKIEISAVASKKERDLFIRFPWRIYRGNRNWVPPLLADMKRMLDRTRNPFFQHSEAEYFLAYRNGEVVGRVAAILNNNHNAFHEEKAGFFGFFEAIDDRDVAAALLQQAEAWVRERGMRVMRGPTNFSTNDTCGMLLDAFDLPPMIMMTYNPSYYNTLMEACGYRKAQDLLAYRFYAEQGFNPRIRKISAAVQKRFGVRLRELNMKNFWGEVEIIKQIYNDAWSRNWGFVPLTDAEIMHLAKELKPIVDPQLVIIAEIDDEAVGFALTLRDFNQALRRINGRLFPFGLFKLLYYSHRIDAARVMILGVIKKYQKMRGLGSLLYERTFDNGTKMGLKWGEFSWILESNHAMRSAVEAVGAQVYKTYRIYEKSL